MTQKSLPSKTKSLGLLNGYLLASSKSLCGFAFAPPVATRPTTAVLPSSPAYFAVPLTPKPTTTALSLTPRERWDIEENSRRERWEIEERRRRASTQGGGGGVGETAAGALLGGLLLGPFGALFGASIGSSIGSRNAVDRARVAEMESRGVSPELLESAQEIGMVLQQSMEGLKATQDSLATQQRIARRLEAESEELYDKAQKALSMDNEDLARRLLFERTRVKEKLVSTLKNCAEERKRLAQMEMNVDSLEERAQDVEQLLRRSMGAKTMAEADKLGYYSLDDEDPLLRKFRDMGIN